MVLRASRQAAEILAAGDGKARVSRQAVEILAAGDGALRISRQSVEVLAEAGTWFLDAESPIAFTQTVTTLGPISKSLESAITFAQLARIGDDLIHSATSEFTFASSLVYSGPITVEASSTITFIDAVDANYPHRSPVSQVYFVNTCNGTIEFNSPKLTSEISFEQGVELWYPRHLTGSSELVFEHVVGGTYTYWKAATNNITETEYVWDDDEYTWTLTDIGLRQEATILLEGTKTVASPITFQQVTVVGHAKASALLGDAGNFISFVQEGRLSFFEDVSQTLTFVQDATPTNTKPVSSTITFSQVATNIGVYVPEAESTIAIYQALTFELYREGVLCTYSPFIGTNEDPDAPTAPAPTAPTLVTHNNVQLTYPLIAPTETLTLRGPELGNKDKLSFQRINRETRGGRMVVFADPMWPQTQTMVLEFYGLYEAETQAGLAFVTASLGKQIGVRDWEGREWKGVITNPETPLIRNSKDNNSITFEIDAELVYLNQSVEDTVVFVNAVTRVFVPAAPEGNILAITTDATRWALLNREAESPILFVSTGSHPLLTWEAFTEAEWGTFSTFEWDRFA